MKKILVGLVGVLFFCSCTYPLRIINENDFEPVQEHLSGSVKLGFLSTNDRLLNEAIQEVGLHSSIAKVSKNCTNGSNPELDFMCELLRREKRSASGQNFFITLPGFVIFTHSWLGYKYTVEIKTKSTIFNNQGKELNEVVISTPYEIRYTSFARGAATSLVGWLTPGWGLLNIIPGTLFSGYFDKRALPDFYAKATPSYKAFVSSKIIEQLKSIQSTTGSNTKEIKCAKIVLADEDCQKYNERHFGVEIYKIGNGILIPFEKKVVELPKNILEKVNTLESKSKQFDNKDYNELLSFLTGSFVKSISYQEYGVYKMAGNKIVTLKQGDSSYLFTAMK